MTDKEKINRYLWERDFSRDLESKMIEGLVSTTHVNEYLGRDLKVTEVGYLRSMVKMFVSILINYYMDKIIDAVIDAQEEITALRNKV